MHNSISLTRQNERSPNVSWNQNKHVKWSRLNVKSNCQLLPVMKCITRDVPRGIPPPSLWRKNIFYLPFISTVSASADCRLSILHSVLTHSIGVTHKDSQLELFFTPLINKKSLCVSGSGTIEPHACGVTLIKVFVLHVQNRKKIMHRLLPIFVYFKPV